MTIPMENRIVQRLAVIAVVLLLTALSLRPTLNSGFVNFDDDVYVLKNPQIRSLSPAGVGKMFRTTIEKVYSPLVTLSFAVEYHFYGLNPFVYHLDNLFLHLAVVCLAMIFGMQLGLGSVASALAALLFGIHPMHVESVAWVTERKDVLYSFFYMLALCCYAGYLKKRTVALYAAVVASGVLSLLSKPMAVSLPLALFLCDWYFERKRTVRSMVEKFVLGVIAVPIVWQTYSRHLDANAADPIGSVLNGLWALTFYVAKFFFPWPVEVFYKTPDVAASGLAYAGAAVFAGSMAVLLWRFRRNKIFVFAGFFYLLSIFFLVRATHTFNYSPGGKPEFLVANRFMYLPSLGYCLLTGAVLKAFLEWSRTKGRMSLALAAALTALLISWLSLESFRQCGNWKDGLHLWNAVIAGNPQSATAYNNRGTLQETVELALKDYSRCIELDSDFPEAYFNRARIYAGMGRYDLAIADYTRCVALDPKDGESFLLRSQAYVRQGRFDRALKDALKAQSLGLKVNGDYLLRLSSYMPDADKCPLSVGSSP